MTSCQIFKTLKYTQAMGFLNKLSLLFLEEINVAYCYFANCMFQLVWIRYRKNLIFKNINEKDSFWIITIYLVLILTN